MDFETLKRYNDENLISQLPSLQSISARTKWTGGFGLKFNPYPPVHIVHSIHFRPYTFLYRQIWIEVQFISARTYFCTGGNELNEQYVWADMDWTLGNWEIKFSSFYLFKVSKSIQRFRSYSQQQILLSIGKNTSIGVAEIFTSN